jgi:hypothetical protein
MFLLAGDCLNELVAPTVLLILGMDHTENIIPLMLLPIVVVQTCLCCIATSFMVVA